MDAASVGYAPWTTQGELAASRSRGYAFLARLVLEGPDILFIERMLGDDVGSSVASLVTSGGSHPIIIAGLMGMRTWLAMQTNQSLEQLRQELAVQQAWLFKGIAPGYGPPPPYEAVYRRSGAGVDADTLLSLREFYREVAADLPPSTHERLDHLGMELDFMRFACAEESRFWCANEVNEAGRHRRIQRRFLAQHLVPWVPEYCQRILGEPCAPFFHGLARILSGFLAEDVALLDKDGEVGARGPDPRPLR